MVRQSANIYKTIVRSSAKEPSLKTRQLTPEQILSLRYQCALENKDFKTAESLKALMPSLSRNSYALKARKKAERLFKK